MRDPATGEVVVSWPYVWGATRYELWRSGRRLAVTKLMRYVDPGPTPGAIYSVRALNSGGRSAPSTAAPGPA